MYKFIYSLSIIFVGLSLGYIFQILYNKEIIKTPFSIDTLRKTLQKIAILFFNPVTFIGAVWIVNLNNIKMIAFPFIGITALILGGVFAFLFSKMLKMSRKKTGAYIVSGSFTNIGAIGSLICFIFLGEPAFAMVPFYKLFEEFSYYAFGFPMAKSFSDDVNTSGEKKNSIGKIFSDPFVLVVLSGIITGFILNLSGIKRPEFYRTINSIFIPTLTILLLSSIGMAIKLKNVFKYLKEGVFIGVIKFVLIPIIVTSIGFLIGFSEIDNGRPLKVLLILSSMPVGFLAMVPPTIYNLDIDLANACWLVTNLLLIFEIPLLYMLINFL